MTSSAEQKAAVTSALEQNQDSIEALFQQEADGAKRRLTDLDQDIAETVSDPNTIGLIRNNFSILNSNIAQISLIAERYIYNRTGDPVNNPGQNIDVSYLAELLEGNPPRVKAAEITALYSNADDNSNADDTSFDQKVISNAGESDTQLTELELIAILVRWKKDFEKANPTESSNSIGINAAVSQQNHSPEFNTPEGVSFGEIPRDAIGNNEEIVFNPAEKTHIKYFLDQNQWKELAPQAQTFLIQAALTHIFSAGNSPLTDWDKDDHEEYPLPSGVNSGFKFNPADASAEWTEESKQAIRTFAVVIGKGDENINGLTPADFLSSLKGDAPEVDETSSNIAEYWEILDIFVKMKGLDSQTITEIQGLIDAPLDGGVGPVTRTKLVEFFRKSNPTEDEKTARTKIRELAGMPVTETITLVLGSENKSFEIQKVTTGDIIEYTGSNITPEGVLPNSTRNRVFSVEGSLIVETSTGLEKASDLNTGFIGVKTMSFGMDNYAKEGGGNWVKYEIGSSSQMKPFKLNNKTYIAEMHENVLAFSRQSQVDQAGSLKDAIVIKRVDGNYYYMKENGDSFTAIALTANSSDGTHTHTLSLDSNTTYNVTVSDNTLTFTPQTTEAVQDAAETSFTDSTTGIKATLPSGDGAEWTFTGEGLKQDTLGGKTILFINSKFYQAAEIPQPNNVATELPSGTAGDTSIIKIGNDYYPVTDPNSNNFLGDPQNPLGKLTLGDFTVLKIGDNNPQYQKISVSESEITTEENLTRPEVNLAESDENSQNNSNTVIPPTVLQSGEGNDATYYEVSTTGNTLTQLTLTGVSLEPNENTRTTSSETPLSEVYQGANHVYVLGDDGLTQIAFNPSASDSDSNARTFSYGGGNATFSLNPVSIPDDASAAESNDAVDETSGPPENQQEIIDEILGDDTTVEDAVKSAAAIQDLKNTIEADNFLKEVDEEGEAETITTVPVHADLQTAIKKLATTTVEEFESAATKEEVIFNQALVDKYKTARAALDLAGLDKLRITVLDASTETGVTSLKTKLEDSANTLKTNIIEALPDLITGDVSTKINTPIEALLKDLKFANQILSAEQLTDTKNLLQGIYISISSKITTTASPSTPDDQDLITALNTSLSLISNTENGIHAPAVYSSVTAQDAINTEAISLFGVPRTGGENADTQNVGIRAWAALEGATFPGVRSQAVLAEKIKLKLINNGSLSSEAQTDAGNLQQLAAALAEQIVENTDMRDHTADDPFPYPYEVKIEGGAIYAIGASDRNEYYDASNNNSTSQTVTEAGNAAEIQAANFSAGATERLDQLDWAHYQEGALKTFDIPTDERGADGYEAPEGKNINTLQFLGSGGVTTLVNLIDSLYAHTKDDNGKESNKKMHEAYKAYKAALEPLVTTGPHQSISWYDAITSNGRVQGSSDPNYNHWAPGNSYGEALDAYMRRNGSVEIGSGNNKVKLDSATDDLFEAAEAVLEQAEAFLGDITEHSSLTDDQNYKNLKLFVAAMQEKLEGDHPSAPRWLGGRWGVKYDD